MSPLRPPRVRSGSVLGCAAQGESQAAEEMGCQGVPEGPAAGAVGGVLADKPRPPLRQQHARPRELLPYGARLSLRPQALEALRGPADPLKAGEGATEVGPARQGQR